MGLHSDLPLYQTVYELLQLIVRLVKHMPREFKQALGGELRDQALKITVLILRANTAADKEPHLMEIIERKETIELLVRLSRDMQLISTGQYAQAIELVASVGKQTNGWRKQQSRQTHDGHGHHDRPLF